MPSKMACGKSQQGASWPRVGKGHVLVRWIRKHSIRTCYIGEFHQCAAAKLEC